MIPGFRLKSKKDWAYHQNREIRYMTKLDKATNVAIIPACAFLVGTLARNYYPSSRPNPRLTPQIAQ
jgi:hypothetical protein